MGVFDTIIRSVGSLTIVDDFDDYSSSNDTTVVERRRPHTISGATVRPRRPASPRLAPTLSELKRENRELRQRQEKLEKEVARARRHAEHYRERKKEIERERERLEVKVKELEITVENMKESYQAELDDVRERLEKSATASTQPLPNHPTRSQPPPSQPAPSQSATHNHESDEKERSKRSQTPYASEAQTDAELLRQLEERNEEIRVLRLYVDTTDELSITDIVSMVTDLNTEISTIAASIVDSLVFVKTWEMEQSWALESSESGLSDCLQLLAAGSAIDYSTDPTLVQLAFQGWIIHCCKAIFDGFCFGLSDEEDSLLKRIFDGIQHSESQAVAARWRTLSHSHARTARREGSMETNPFDISYNQESKALEGRMLTGLLSIILFAGGRNPLGNMSSILQEKFGPRILSMIDMAGSLATVMSEKFLSSRLMISSEDAAAVYDPSKMESIDADRSLEQFKGGDDEDDRQRRDAGASVMCTIGFGLESVQKRKSKRRTWEVLIEDEEEQKSKSGSSGTTGPSQSISRSVALKPKVLLSSTLEMMQKNLQEGSD